VPSDLLELCDFTVDADKVRPRPGSKPFYLIPLLIAPAYFLARPLPTKSS